MANERVLEAVGTTIVIGSFTGCLENVQPIGTDGGEAIDVTCLSNTQWVTKQPQTLMEVPDISFSCLYDPGDLPTINGEINKNQIITINFNDASNLVFWGYLKAYEPQSAGKGDKWLANGTVVVTNMNAVGVEVAPVYNAP
jgi:hypothetical protein